MNEDNERVGSVAEEAAKLLGALQGWAKESEQESATAAGAASAFKSINEHIATEGEDCKYCPVCQLISVVRRTSPEVKQHLTAATTSLLQAATAAMTTVATESRAPDSSATFEKIDLSDDRDWETD